MEISKLTNKHIFIRLMTKDDSNTFYVSENIRDGLRTIVLTQEPTLAKTYTLKEAFEFVYNHLTESERDIIVKAKDKNDSYAFITRHLAKWFRVFAAVEIDYGYSSDIREGVKLLDSLGLSYMYQPPQEVETK